MCVVLYVLCIDIMFCVVLCCDLSPYESVCAIPRHVVCMYPPNLAPHDPFAHVVSAVWGRYGRVGRDESTRLMCIL